MTVDAHAHIIVPEITRDAAPKDEWRPRVFWDAQGQVVEFAGAQIRSATKEFVHVGGCRADVCADRARGDA